MDSAGEPGADFSDTLRSSIFGAAIWRVEEDLSLGVGAFVNRRLEGDWRAFPIPVIDWRFAEGWRFRTEGRLDRVSAVVSHDVADDFVVGAELGFFGQRYRLEDEGPAADGIFEERRFFAGLSAEWKVSSGFSLLGLLGVQFGGRFELDDDDGDRIERTDLGVAPIVGLGFELRF